MATINLFGEQVGKLSNGNELWFKKGVLYIHTGVFKKEEFPYRDLTGYSLGSADGATVTYLLKVRNNTTLKAHILAGMVQVFEGGMNAHGVTRQE